MLQKFTLLLSLIMTFPSAGFADGKTPLKNIRLIVYSSTQGVGIFEHLDSDLSGKRFRFEECEVNKVDEFQDLKGLDPRGCVALISGWLRVDDQITVALQRAFGAALEKNISSQNSKLRSDLGDLSSKALLAAGSTAILTAIAQSLFQVKAPRLGSAFGAAAIVAAIITGRYAYEHIAKVEPNLHPSLEKLIRMRKFVRAEDELGSKQHLVNLSMDIFKKSLIYASEVTGAQGGYTEY